MLRLSRRLSAVVLSLAISAGHAGVCAGWMPTPDARMACCSDGVSCPMHPSEPQEDGSNRVVSQADADRCCAASEQDDSAPSPSSLSFVITLGNALSPVPVVIPKSLPQADIWRASVRMPAPRVPKHLLLSVLLV